MVLKCSPDQVPEENLPIAMGGWWLVAFHRPHPGNIVKGYVLKEVKNLLDEIDSYD